MALKTPISILQELVVSKREAPPNYLFESTGNLLNPEFTCTVTALSVTVTDSARNKKEAKQKVAAKALAEIYKLGSGFNELDQQHSPSSSSTATLEDCTPKIPPDFNTAQLNYVGMLNEYAASNKSVAAIIYRDSCVTSDHFEVSCICGTKRTVGYGRNKKQAKQEAACAMLEYLKQSKSTSLSCKIPKKVEVDDEMIISKFQELSTSGVKKNARKEDFVAINITEDTYSVTEAKEMLKKLDLNYHVETIQEDPYLVVVQLENAHITTMGKGESEELATQKAMNQILSKIKAGCSLTE